MSQEHNPPEQYLIHPVLCWELPANPHNEGVRNQTNVADSDEAPWPVLSYSVITTWMKLQHTSIAKGSVMGVEVNAALA